MVALSPGAEHRVLLRGLRLAEGGVPAAPPVLALPGLSGLEQVFADLCDPQRRAALAARLLHPLPDRPARLWLPLHRYQQVILLEAVCEHAHGTVPIARSCIDSAGLCTRLLADGQRWAWLRDNGRTLGWQPLLGQAEPDATRRIGATSADARRLQRLGLAAAPPTTSEATTPLFVAPPEVCAACATTVLCGVIATGAVDHAPQAERPAGLTPDFVAAGLPQFLRAAPKSEFGLVGRRIDALALAAPDRALRRFLDGLAWVLGVAGLAEQHAQGLAFAAHLDRYRVGDEAFADFLRRAHRFCVAGDRSSADADGRLLIPDWPQIAADHERESKRLAWETVAERWEQLAPARGRFDDPHGRYHLQPFVRLRTSRGCPPRLVWGDGTGPFAIVPWYEGSDQPPPVIDLPDPDDLGRIAPNAAFRVPPKLKEMMEKSGLKSLVDGAVPEGGGWNVMWICRIPIPIITIVAFFVFNIFLSICIALFFWFSLVLKICIPIPVPTPPEDE